MTKMIFLAGTLLFISSNSQADVVSIADPSFDVPNTSTGVMRPIQGMSMAEVSQQYGQADQEFAAIGEPPITRWTYGDFVVFFEHHLVIHSVVPR